MEQLSQHFNNVSLSVSTGDDGKQSFGNNDPLSGKNQNERQLVLLSSPGVFGGVETGQVSVLFDDIHLFRRPTQTGKRLEADYKLCFQKYQTFSCMKTKLIII